MTEQLKAVLADAPRATVLPVPQALKLIHAKQVKSHVAEP